MPTFDFATLGGVLANLGVSILSYAGIAAILYNIGKLLLRTVSWTLDNMLISMIAKFYGYFEQILSGTIFSDSLVKGMMNRVYLIIGVILLFRLGMLLVQYMINPSQVMEEKGGVNSLVKRAIIGLCLIIFIPTIFDIANDLQAAILKDQVIERIIMDKSDLDKLEEQKKEYGTGRVIAMTIYQGFWNINEEQVADKKIVRAYKEAGEKKDPSLIEDAGYSILTESGGKYAFDYFPILSTVVLAYVLYLVVKYCIDMVVRVFKLLVLQIISPITIVEYIVNGDRNEVFQKWKKSVVANYAMLFVRVFTIWFVAFVALLMSGPKDGTLLTTPDYLLKAIIVLGLLAFMMDFPKMMSDIFGLDLEQDASVKGVLGKAIGAGVAGLAVGGAVAGLGLKAAHGTSSAAKGGLTAFAQNRGKESFANGLRNPVKSSLGGIGQGLSKTKLGKGASSLLNKAASSNIGSGAGELATAIKDKAKEQHLGKKLIKGAAVAGASIAKANKASSSVYSGFSSVSQSMDEVDKKAEAKALEGEERASRQQIMAATTTIIGQNAATNFKLDDIKDNTEVTATRTVNIDNKLGKVSGNIGNIANSVGDIAKNVETTATRTVNIDNKVGKISSNIGDISSKVSDIGKNAEVTATQTVNVDQKLGKISGDISNISDNTEISADVALNIEPLVGNMDESLKKIDTNTEMSAVVDLDVEPVINDMGQNVHKLAEDKNKKDNSTDELL